MLRSVAAHAAENAPSEPQNEMASVLPRPDVERGCVSLCCSLVAVRVFLWTYGRAQTAWVPSGMLCCCATRVTFHAPCNSDVFDIWSGALFVCEYAGGLVALKLIRVLAYSCV